jgi:hypothetical protein
MRHYFACGGLESAGVHDKELLALHIDFAVIIMSKPPALPGDSKSLTFPGLCKSLPFLNRSKFKKRKAFDGQVSKFKSHSVGMQVPCRVDSEMP